MNNDITNKNYLKSTSKNCYVVIQDDKNLVIYDSNDKSLWSSNTVKIKEWTQLCVLTKASTSASISITGYTDILAICYFTNSAGATIKDTIMIPVKMVNTVIEQWWGGHYTVSAGTNSGGFCLGLSTTTAMYYDCWINGSEVTGTYVIYGR